MALTKSELKRRNKILQRNLAEKIAKEKKEKILALSKSIEASKKKLDKKIDELIAKGKMIK